MATFPGFTAQDESDTVGLSSMSKSAPFPAHGSETAGGKPPASETVDRKPKITAKKTAAKNNAGYPSRAAYLISILTFSILTSFVFYRWI